MPVRTLQEAWASHLPAKVCAKDLGMHEMTVLGRWFEDHKLTPSQFQRLARGTWSQERSVTSTSALFDLPIPLLRKIWKKAGLLNSTSELRVLGERYASGEPILDLAEQSGLSAVYLAMSFSRVGIKRQRSRIDDDLMLKAYGRFLAGKRGLDIARDLKVSPSYLQNNWRRLLLPGRKETLRQLRDKWDQSFADRVGITEREAARAWRKVSR